MLELLMTSHGSSGSCGIIQGTGCSRVLLRAITSQTQEVTDSIDPKRRKEIKKRRRRGREGNEKDKEEKVRGCISNRKLVLGFQKSEDKRELKGNRLG